MRTITIYLCLLLSFIYVGFSYAQTDIQSVRISFQNPEGFTRQLLLGFVSDNSATDGVDYGYDALNIDNLDDDLNWIIEDGRYVIQGTGAFSVDKYYPLGMFLTNSGDIAISLVELENFEESIEVYLYDSELETYALLNTVDYINNLPADTYLNRFYIAFSTNIGSVISTNSALSTNENQLENLKIWHSNSNDELYIKGISNLKESSISLYTMEGKKIIEEVISSNNSNDNFNISTSAISDGIYILKIDSTSSSYTTKVCIAN